MGEIMDGIIPLSVCNGLQAELETMGSGLVPKGVVASASELPDTGEVGDMYLVADEGYTTYVWDNENNEYAPKRNGAATVEEYMAALYG